MRESMSTRSAASSRKETSAISVSCATTPGKGRNSTFPLEISLHAYRCGHRVLSQWLRAAVTATLTAGIEQAVAAVADFSIEYANTISVIAAAEYVACTRALAEAEGNQRTELLTILLSGYDEADGRVARLLKRAGYLEQRQAYCVVLAQPVNAAEMEHPERAQRIIAALGDALAGTSIRLLAGVRNNVVTAILSDLRRQSGWTAPRSTLAQRVHGLLQVLGPSVLVGISADHPSTAFHFRGPAARRKSHLILPGSPRACSSSTRCRCAICWCAAEPTAFAPGRRNG